MKEIIIATGNRHKFKEISDILKGISVRLRSLSDFPEAPEVIEDGKTIEENAVKKARVIAKRFKQWTLADDTGLEVAYLGGAPGVISARWAGPGCSYDDNNRKLLSLLQGIPKSKRGARFRSVIAVASPQGDIWTVEGKIRGVIATRPRGGRGFGYDPVFLIPRFRKTFSELRPETKNRVSHRALALEKAKKLIKILSSDAKCNKTRQIDRQTKSCYTFLRKPS